MKELNPCPFCGSRDLRGSKNIDISHGKVVENIIYIQCLKCGSEGPKPAYGYDPIEGWNQRFIKRMNEKPKETTC